MYAELATARLRPVAPGLVALALLVVTLGANGLTGSPAAAIAPSSPRSPTVAEFRAIVVPPEPDATPADTSAADRLAATAAAPSLSAVASPVPAVEIVRFRPRDGQTRISRVAQVSVRFTGPMDRSTRRAFTVMVNGSPVTGRYRWAEGDTVLVFVPSTPFPYRARVRLSVTSDARGSDGAPIATARSVSFSVERKPAPGPAATTVATRPQPSRAPRPATSSEWRWPLIGPITQYFGQSLTKYGYHYGIDIDGQTGDPVRAARSGTVTVAGHYDSCSGLQVTIDHGSGFESWYRHLSRIDVRVGQRVTAGTVIGRVGATGCALGSHLHFAIRHHGTFVDPMRYLPRR